MKNHVTFLVLASGPMLASCGTPNQPSKRTEKESDSIRLRTVLYRPGDYDSKNYRIPAIITACNGDIIRYSSVKDGDEKNILLHSLPGPERRENVIVYVSYDEGQTWPVSKCIVPYEAAYSSLCILPDHSSASM